MTDTTTTQNSPLKKNAGDIIKASDWNQLVDLIDILTSEVNSLRSHLKSHDHTGNIGDKIKKESIMAATIDGSLIDPSSSFGIKELILGETRLSEKISSFDTSIDALEGKLGNLALMALTMNLAIGPSSKDGRATVCNFALNKKSNCLFLFTGTAWRDSIGGMQLHLYIDDNLLATSCMFTNEKSSHKTFPSGYLFCQLEAGHHSVRFGVDSSSIVDVNDGASCAAIAFPV